MPYIVTATTPRGPVGDVSRMTRADAAQALEWQAGSDVARVAAATLADARDACFALMARHPRYVLADAAALARSIYALPGDGGTVGTLADGTVIAVQRVTFRTLEARAHMSDHDHDADDTAAIIAAFNAAP